VISDPAKDADNVLIVNFTTRRSDSDPACILRVGEHPFVHHETCVNYAGAKIVSVAQITTLLQAGQMVNHAPVSTAILERIREGAGNSTRMALDHADILIDQGLLDC
jgi:MinD superfamily P-loop ATPase